MWQNFYREESHSVWIKNNDTAGEKVLDENACVGVMTKNDTGKGICESPRDKINKVTVRPAKTQISLGIRPV